MDEALAQKYGARCHSEAPAVLPYGPGLQSYTEGFMPDALELGAFDAFMDLEQPARAATEKLQHMLRAHKWLDDATKSLTLQAAMFNAEAIPPMFGTVEVHFDFARSG